MRTPWIVLMVGVAAAWVGAMAAAGPARAGMITLSSGDSIAQFNPESPALHFRWQVDGVNQLREQGFWYRIGPSGGEAPLYTLGPATVKTADFDYDGFDDFLRVKYVGAGLTAEIAYMLIGGDTGSGTSALTESIRLTNTGTAALDLHFFQYVDFDLNGDPDHDTLLITDENTATQTSGPVTLAEGVDSPAPTHYQAAVYSEILKSLGDSLPTTLMDVAGPIVDGNATWAFEWDVSIVPGGTFLISKDKSLQVPEPATLVFLGLGLGGLLVQRRRAR